MLCRAVHAVVAVQCAACRAEPRHAGDAWWRGSMPTTLHCGVMLVSGLMATALRLVHRPIPRRSWSAATSGGCKRRSSSRTRRRSGAPRSTGEPVGFFAGGPPLEAAPLLDLKPPAEGLLQHRARQHQTSPPDVHSPCRPRTPCTIQFSSSRFIDTSSSLSPACCTPRSEWCCTLHTLHANQINQLRLQSRRPQRAGSTGGGGGLGSTRYIAAYKLCT